MESPDSGDSPSPTRKKLVGPRPPQLRVRKESHSIRKPPIPHAPPHTAANPPEPRQPVIIYAVSPKVIHTTTTEFMSLVQRLTGPSPTFSGGGNVSPAARLASLERTSPREREKEREIGNDLVGISEGVEVGMIPGILSPAPAALPPISPGFFSPVVNDQFALSIMNDLSSPLFRSYNSNNYLFPSPSNLFSSPIASTSPSFADFNPFFDF